MTDFIPCEKCTHSSGPMKGYYYEPSTLPGYPDVLTECECHKKWRTDNMLVLKAKKAEILIDAFSLNYDPVKDYAGSKSRYSVSKLATVIASPLMYQGIVLYCYGAPGTQKTTILNWAGLKLLREGYSVLKYRMQKLNEALKPDIMQRHIEGGYASDSELIQKDLLIIDQSFMKDQVTISASGYQLPYLENFLRERIESRSGITIFESNCHPSEIVKNGFSSSIQSLIFRNTVQKDTVLLFEDSYEGITKMIRDSDIKDMWK